MGLAQPDLGRAVRFRSPRRPQISLSPAFDSPNLKTLHRGGEGRSGQALSEWLVVRHDQSHHDAVKFTCDWIATVISRLLASLQ